MRIKIILFSITLLIFIGTIIFLSQPTYYDKQACILRSLAVKGIVSKVQPGHQVTFTINSIKGEFPMSFTKKADPRDEVKEIQPGEIVVTLCKGDSILKTANSDVILFKRGGRKFFRYLYCKNCD